MAGIRNVFDAWNYLKGFDIIMLQETWLEEDKRKEIIGKLSKEFAWKVKVAVRESRKGRDKGGIIVGVRKENLNNVEMEEWTYGIVVKRIRTAEGKCNIINVYNNAGVGKFKEGL